MSSTPQRLEPRIRASADDAAFAFVGARLCMKGYASATRCVAVTPRQGTAFYSACPDAGREARRVAVPDAHYLHGVLIPEAATRWPRPRLCTNLSSRAAMRRGICFLFQAACLCMAQASACVPRFCRGGVYP